MATPSPPPDEGPSSQTSVTPRPKARRICLIGATGTIGGATARALIQGGHDVVCFARKSSISESGAPLEGSRTKVVNVSDPTSVAQEGFSGEHFDAVISCMASRTGAPKDAWAIDYQAHVNLLTAAKAAGIKQWVQLSAICVQKPSLEFQKAKLAFEAALMASDLTYSIVRPTAFFKSLSGQIARVKMGRPFLVFGDGALTSCKPISDQDLAAYLVDCLDDEARWDQILPIGGPGPAITPKDQGEALFAMVGRAPRFTHVPVAMMDAVIVALGLFGRVAPHLADKAELARIGRYYATQSMLVWDPTQERYDALATPETGTRTLFDYYRAVLSGHESVERGDHSVF